MNYGYKWLPFETVYQWCGNQGEGKENFLDLEIWSAYNINLTLKPLLLWLES